MPLPIIAQSATTNKARFENCCWGSHYLTICPHVHVLNALFFCFNLKSIKGDFFTYVYNSLISNMFKCSLMINMNIYSDILSPSSVANITSTNYIRLQKCWSNQHCTVDWWWQRKEQKNGSSFSLSFCFFLSPSLLGGARRFWFSFLQWCSGRKYGMSTT